MESIVQIKDVSLKFKLYGNKSSGIKELLIDKIHNRNFGENKEFWVLNDINLDINQGDRVGIIGNNGAGKSTLLKLISSIYTPTKGEIIVKGKVAPLIELGAGFNPELTGRENIYLNGCVLGYSKNEILEKEKDILEFADIGDFADMPVKYYSTGMYMRLAFAIATEVKPEVLIIDELFAGGDINFIDKATKRMYELIDHSKVMIMVSHSMDLIKKLCNKVIVIQNNRIVYIGEPEKAIEYYYNANNANLIKE